MANLVCVDDYENHAKKIFSKTLFEYFQDGSGRQDTFEYNKKGFKKYRIRPKYLRNVERLNINRKILGKDVSLPIGISPTAFQKLAHPYGEIASVKAAQDLNTIYILSLYATTSMEDIKNAAPNCRKWLQMFPMKRREVSRDLIATAEKSGFEALVITCDFPVIGNRLSFKRNTFKIPTHLEEAVIKKYLNDGSITPTDGSVGDSSADWGHIKWLTTVTNLPIIVKGVLTAEDAILAVQAGASAILVSNHGGRQLDGVPATIEALPEIVKAVAGEVEVYMDGGIRDGTDVYKALALGAKMVFIGRPVIWGLVHNGEEGVKKVLSILKHELETALRISGCANLDEVTPDRVVHEMYYSKI